MTNGKNGIFNLVIVEYIDGKKVSYGSWLVSERKQIFVEIKDRYVEICDNSCPHIMTGRTERVCIPIGAIRCIRAINVDGYNHIEGKHHDPV